MKAIVIGVLFAAGCGAMAHSGETLDDSVRAYNEGIRWSRFETAATHVPAAQRAQFVDDWDQRAKDLRITDYEVVKVEPKNDHEAKVEVKLEWYKDSEGTVHETRAQQTWERHGHLWLLVDEARLRGTEMPGLPEPMMKD